MGTTSRDPLPRAPLSVGASAAEWEILDGKRVDLQSGAPGPAGPGSGAPAGPGSDPCLARPARPAGPGLPLPGPARALCRARLATPGPMRPNQQAEEPGGPGEEKTAPGKPSCPGPSAAHRPARSLTAGPGQEGLPGPFCARRARRGENRPGKSTLGGPGAATFDPAGARRCPCRAGNWPRPGLPHLRPGPQLYPAASYSKQKNAKLRVEGAFRR